MRFHCYVNPQTPGPDHDTAIIDAVTEQAVEADRAGFAGICLTEHHFSDYNTYGDPFLFGSYLAPQLANAWVILTVAVAPLHNPLKLAERINLLDQLTKGRLIVGIGPGSSPFEFAGFGRDLSQSATDTEQVLRIVQEVLEHDRDDPPYQWKTAFGSGELLGRIMPASYRRPHPHFGRGALSDKSTIDTARRGWPLFTGRVGPEAMGAKFRLYRETLADAGHAQATIDHCLRWSSVQKTIWVAETDAEAQRLADEPLRVQTSLGTRAHQSGPKGTDVSSALAQKTGIRPGDRAGFVEGATIIGSPETVVSRIKEYQAQGVPGMAMHFTWGHADTEAVRRSFRLFVDEVMPHFADEPAA